MADLGPHAGFIVGSYAAVFAVLAALIGWIVSDARRQERLLAELESKGIKRRSAKTKGKRK